MLLIRVRLPMIHEVQCFHRIPARSVTMKQELTQLLSLEFVIDCNNTAKLVTKFFLKKPTTLN